MKPTLRLITLFITVLALTLVPKSVKPVDAASLVTETFRNSSASNWLLLGSACLTAGGTNVCATAPTSEGNGNGWLRLTSNGIWQSGSAIYNTAFSSTGGIQVTFTYATYGGTGADGISFYLIDGSTTSPTIGGQGGSLGYSFKLPAPTAPGVTNGYVGIGLDEWGNFSHTDFGSCAPTCPGTIPNSVTIRGSGNLFSGFNYLTRANATIGTGSRAGAKKVRITIPPGATTSITIEIDSGSGYQTIINNFNLTSAVGQSTMPASFKMGFSASTGASTNYHEIRDLTVNGAVATATTLTSDINPSAGETVTFTANVTSGSGTPTGTVTFLDGTTILGTGILNGVGQATFNTSALSVGSRSITARYEGDSEFGSSTSTILTQVVTCANAITVTNANDSGAGSLRQAIVDICPNGTITFGGNYTITLSSQLAINKSLTIDGVGHTVAISGNNAVRVFYVSAGTVTISNLTIQNGRAAVIAGEGGTGLYITGGGTAVTLNNCAVINNSMTGLGTGGGIVVKAGSTLAMNNCTVSGNSSTFDGGGILNTGTLTINSSTITNNTTPGAGGGLENAGSGATTIRNTIIAGNTGNPATGPDCYTPGPAIQSLGYNRIGTTTGCTITANVTDVKGFPFSSLLLGSLQNNGGSTSTHTLLPGSPAIDAIPGPGCNGAPSSDQRGIVRPQPMGGACDVGAFESRGFTLTETGGDGQSAAINTAFANPLALNVTSAFGEPVNDGRVTFTPPGSGASAGITGSPATISGGSASVTAAANGTVGGPYDVTASTRGAADLDFDLTNLPLPNLSIDDVSLAEGNSGTTTFSFTVSLSAPAPVGGVTFDIATQDNTATTADNDYVGQSLTGQTIPAGTSTYVFDVTVNGDSSFEAGETFHVNVTNAGSATIADGQGLGTIQNDDNDPPTVSANGPYSVNEGGSVTLNATGNDPESGPLTYAWDLDNDGTFETAGQSVTFPAAVLDGPSSHTVIVQVTDNASLTATDTTTVNVQNVAPTTSSVINDGPINEGSSANITVSASDPALLNDPLEYEFDCDNDSVYEVGPQAGNSASCTFDDNGSFTVNVRVSDGDGDTASGSTSVVVVNVAPTATFNAPASTTVGTPFNISLDPPYGEPSSADTAAGFQYTFDCGAGYGTYSGTSDASCTWGIAGNVTVRGRIRDKDLGETEYTASVSILDVTAPTVVSILRQIPLNSPTNAATVTFQITFSENVQNVNTADFALATTGTATGTIDSIGGVPPTNVYTVTITGVSGNGVLDLNFAPGNDIADILGNALGASPTIGTEETYTIDNTSPIVIYSEASVPSADGVNLTVGPSQLLVQFSENVLGDSSPHSADSRWNYLLLRPGPNGVFDTTINSPGICDPLHTLDVGVDDEKIETSEISYDAETFIATLTIDPLFAPLANGMYRLYMCGAASIWDLSSMSLNGGNNVALNFTVSPEPVAAAKARAKLPETGFAPNRATFLPPQTVFYADLGDFWLEIPKLGVKMPIVGIPQTDGSWDVSWLGSKAGWLEGSAYPSWNGNSVLTSHVWNADNSAGPFRFLNTLWWGDEVIIHLAGQQYIYEVRSVKQVAPTNINAMMKHEDLPWLTLVTCKGYDEETDSYRYRVLVRAVLIEVK